MLIELNDNELKAQIALNDLAVKSGGLQVAEAAVILSKKYMAAQEAANTPQSPAVPTAPVSQVAQPEAPKES